MCKKNLVSLDCGREIVNVRYPGRQTRWRRNLVRALRSLLAGAQLSGPCGRAAQATRPSGHSKMFSLVRISESEQFFKSEFAPRRSHWIYRLSLSLFPSARISKQHKRFALTGPKGFNDAAGAQLHLSEVQTSLFESFLRQLTRNHAHTRRITAYSFVSKCCPRTLIQTAPEII